MAHVPGEAAYIRGIRNEAKKAYARAFADHLAFPEIHPEPPRPEALSYMAAQAVRMQLAALHVGELGVEIGGGR